MNYHYRETIQSLIEPVKETKVLQKFLYWILSDPKYGTINQIQYKNTIEAVQRVIDLYKEWIDTGINPKKGRWRDAESLAWEVADSVSVDSVADSWAADSSAYAAYVAYISDTTNPDSAAAYVTNAAFANAAANASIDNKSIIPRSEVEKAQIDKLNDLIRTKGEDEDDGLYSWEDYEKDIDIENEKV